MNEHFLFIRYVILQLSPPISHLFSQRVAYFMLVRYITAASHIYEKNFAFILTYPCTYNGFSSSNDHC